jgi:hypothetical protein
MTHRFLSAVAFVIACASFENAAHAENRELAIQLFEQGQKDWAKEKYADACAKYDAAHHAAPTMLGVLQNLALCNEKVGKNATAYAQYKELLFAAKKVGDADRETTAKTRSDALQPKLSYLKISADPTPGLTIHRDGEDVPSAMLGSEFPVDPGKHVIEATAPGYSVWSTSVSIGAAGDKKTLSIPKLSLAPVSEKNAPPNKAKRNVGFALAGLGVAGIGVGAVTGLMAMSDTNNAKSDPLLCQLKCTGAGRAVVDGASTKALISTIGFGAGLAAAGVGVVLIATSGGSKRESDERPHASASVVPLVGPGLGGATFVGAF